MRSVSIPSNFKLRSKVQELASCLRDRNELHEQVEKATTKFRDSRDSQRRWEMHPPLVKWVPSVEAVCFMCWFWQRWTIFDPEARSISKETKDFWSYTVLLPCRRMSLHWTSNSPSWKASWRWRQGMDWQCPSVIGYTWWEGLENLVETAFLSLVKVEARDDGASRIETTRSSCSCTDYRTAVCGVPSPYLSRFA